MHHTTTALIAARMGLGAVRSCRGRVDAGLLRKLAMGLLALALLGAGFWALRKLMAGAEAPKHQVARIAILPDTPPPPPPPPPKERKEEPPKPQKQSQPTPDQPLKPPPQAAAPEALKMEGAAGNGPSAFAAGSVTQDYKGGAPTIGGSGASAAGGAVTDRARERLYAGTVRQMLRDELERHLSPEAGELTAAFALWVAGDGSVSRWEVDTHDAPLDAVRQSALKLALERSAQNLHLPAPQALAQPMRFRLTVRAGG